MKFFWTAGVASFGLILGAGAQGADLPALEQWLPQEAQVAQARLLENVSPPGALPGAAVASPSRANPNYFFHWVRDAALIMNTVITMLQRTPVQSLEYQSLEQRLHDYVSFSLQIQTVPNLSGGLGEPKFEVNAHAFNGPWGRPQNDGPALRAITLIRYARFLLERGRPSDREYVQRELYDGRRGQSLSVIGRDLDFVRQSWTQESVDLWEEVRGQHFYTRLAQWRALKDGSDLARLLGDEASAALNDESAQKLAEVLRAHFRPELGRLVVTLPFERHRHEKALGLDAALILASLHSSRDGFFSPTDDRILATAAALEQVFREGEQAYGINLAYPGLGTAIGRYPFDTYDGVSTKSRGNPWYLTTHAFAELYFRAAREFGQRQVVELTALNEGFFHRLDPQGLWHWSVGQKITASDARFRLILTALHEAGDAFLRRTQFHTPRDDGSLAEEFHRESGFAQGAADLSWSYASFLTAFWER